MLIDERTYSLEEYEAYVAAHPDELLELINGRIVEKVTSEEHGHIVINIGSALKTWQRANSIKGFYSTEASHRRPNDKKNSLRPDVSFRFTDETISTSSTVMQMPDFAVEVKSPGNGYDELREKSLFYLANGARLVWLVYPTKRMIEVRFADKSSEFFLENDELDGGEVLPNFKMRVSEIFDR
jgi:Uma2 family endonuclease